jgi:uncharacterized protein involved in exopolysaccharide biosynthesis
MSALQEHQASASGLTGDELLVLLRQCVSRYRVVIAVVFIATLAGAYTSLQLITEQYETKANLLVKLGRENAEIPTTVLNTGLVAAGVRPEEINSEIQLLHSRPLIEAVVDQLGPQAFAFQPEPPKSFVQLLRYYTKKVLRTGKELYHGTLVLLNLEKKLTARDAAVVLLEDAIVAEPEKGSNVFTVTVRLPSPVLCKQVAETLLRLYLDKRTQAFHNEQEKNFFAAQMEENKTHLSDLERLRDQVRTRWQISSAVEQRSLLLKQLAEIKSQIDLNQSDAAMLEKEQELMRTRLGALPEQVTSSQVQSQNPAVHAMKERWATLQVERAKLDSRYRAESETVKKVQEEITGLNRMLEKEPPMLPGSIASEANPVKRSFEQSIEQGEIKIAGLKAKDEQLQVPANTIANKLRALDAGQDQLVTVDREYKIAEENYLAYAKKAEDARVQEELDALRLANVVVLSEPTVPILPVYPRKLLIMGIALPMGLFFGLFLALLLEYCNETVRTRQDLAGLEGINYLGVLDLRESTTNGATPETGYSERAVGHPG